MIASFAHSLDLGSNVLASALSKGETHAFCTRLLAVGDASKSMTKGDDTEDMFSES